MVNLTGFDFIMMFIFTLSVLFVFHKLYSYQDTQEDF